MDPKMTNVQVPPLKLERFGDSIVRVYFCPAQINPDPELYRNVMNELHVRTSGVVSVDLGYMASGYVTVTRNPIYGSQRTAIDAAQEVADLLRQINT